MRFLVFRKHLNNSIKEKENTDYEQITEKKTGKRRKEKSEQ